MRNYIQISSDLYCDMLQDRFDQAQEWWGNDATESLWESFRDLICEVGVDPNNADPKIVVDNYIVNGEFVPRDEFYPNGSYSYYYNKYNGDWDAMCEDAIVFNDEYAMMQ